MIFRKPSYAEDTRRKRGIDFYPPTYYFHYMIRKETIALIAAALYALLLIINLVYKVSPGNNSSLLVFIFIFIGLFFFIRNRERKRAKL